MWAAAICNFIGTLRGVLPVYVWKDMRVSFCLFLQSAPYSQIIFNAYRCAAAQWLIDKWVQCSVL